MRALEYWTAEMLQEVIFYDPETGQFFKKKTGKEIGPGNKSRYLTIRIGDNKPYYAHRLAWLYVYGSVPGQIDHINGDRRDNRISNLRLCTQSQNMMNTPRQSNNKTGYRGVRLRSTGKYEASISVGGKKIHLGTFEAAIDAAAEYKKASETLYGNFARY